MPDSNDEGALLGKMLEPLPLGEIRPSGWLLAQLRIQAAGLSGHLDEFWPDVAKSGWIGGKAEGWERGPYWLDGVVPLAFLLDDETLKVKVRRWVDYILEHQHSDGWLGPVRDAHYGYEYDPWPAYVTLKALTQYYEAVRDRRVIAAMQRFLRRLDKVLDQQPLKSWGHFRWADLVVSIHWLYEQTHERWLLDLAAKVRAQGFDWHAHFENFPYKEKTRPGEYNLANHVVNNAMAIKEPGVWSRQSDTAAGRRGAFTIMEMLDTYHGQATGVFTGDEHLASRSPSQGTELCAVVEYMYSLETLIAILGDARLGDRLERIAFNALPATFKPDMWAHQYDQQVNQVVCRVVEDRIWTNNDVDSNIFGLDPNFGCCTANMHQGWPKFATHLWMRSPDGGLAAVAYAPSTVRTELQGQPVAIELQTDYPFGDRLRFTVHVPEPARFPILLRIPEWAADAEVGTPGGTVEKVQAGSFHRIEQTWTDGTAITLRLPMKPQITRGYHDSAIVSRGPLVYALRIGEEWKLIKGEPPHGDWEVYPTTPWNYALDLDPAAPESSIRFDAHASGPSLFSPEGAPIKALVSGRRLPRWDLEHNAAAPPPQSPVESSQPLETLTLLPYGCTNLRVAEFPILKR